SFTFLVSDGSLSDTGTVSITINPTNDAPTSDAGSDKSYHTPSAPAVIILNGTQSSDPDGDSLTYSWTQTAGPTVVLENSNDATSSFALPDLSGYGSFVQLEFRLDVSDGFLSSSDSVRVNFTDSQPVVNAGPDQAIDEGTSVTLGGVSASDPDGDSLTYSWTQTAGPAIALSDMHTINPTFSAPAVTADTVLTFQLSVSDGVLSNVDTVDVVVKDTMSTITIKKVALETG